MELLGTVLSGLSGAIGGLAQAGASILNTRETNKTNKNIAEQNLGFQRENLDYQKALQQTIFEREDTAHQREIEDLKRAGINPLATAGGNGANAGSVVPLTELNNSYQAQTADMSGIGAAGQALDAAVQNEKALEDARQAREDQARENMYARTQQHAQFVQELAIREQEANVNMVKNMADIAAQTEDRKLKEKIEDQAQKIAWANYYQQKKEYDENAKYREEQERQLKITNDRAQHDYNIDRKAGTKSSETQDTKVTTGQRIITAIPNIKSENAKESMMKKAKALNQDDALTLKILSQQATSRNLKNGKQIEQYWKTTAKDLSKQRRSKALIDMIEDLAKYQSIPVYK